MKTMIAARYLGPNRIEPEQVDVPEIGPGEALVRVEACGFCGSDLNIVAGTHPRARAPLTIGHELSGCIVRLADDGSSFRVGDRVTMFPLLSCGQCYACTHGSPHVCRKLRLFGFDVDGGMAEFVRLPVDSLMKLPEDMPKMIGALIEPLAVAVHGVGRGNIVAGSGVDATRATVVQGAGPIGLLTALVLQAKGVPHVLISDVLESRLELARELGLHAALAGSDLLKLVNQMTDNNGADALYECAGHHSSAREMTTLVRPRATIVNLGVFKKPVEVDMQAVNFKELQIVGSRVYDRDDFASAIALAGTLPLSGIVSHVFPIANVSLAFEQFQSSNACKVLILPAEHSR